MNEIFNDHHLPSEAHIVQEVRALWSLFCKGANPPHALLLHFHVERKQTSHGLTQSMAHHVEARLSSLLSVMSRPGQVI